MGMSRLRIKTRLIIGFGIVTLLTVILGLTALVEMNRLADLTIDMYQHPLAASNAVRDVRTNIVAMHRSMTGNCTGSSMRY